MPYIGSPEIYLITERKAPSREDSKKLEEMVEDIWTSVWDHGVEFTTRETPGPSFNFAECPCTLASILYLFCVLHCLGLLLG